MRIRRGRGSAAEPRWSRTIPYRRAVLVAVPAFGLVGWLVAGRPGWGAGWLVLAAAALLVGAVLAAVVPRMLPRLVRRYPRPPVTAVAVGLLAALIAVPSGAVAGLVIDDPPVLVREGCPPDDPAVELRMVAAPGQLETTALLATEYELWTARANAGCPTVRSHVYQESTSAVISALAGGWSEVPSLGARPDVWVPDSLAQVTEVREALAVADTRLAGLVEQVAGWSPLVLAVPEPAAGQVPQLHRDSSSWSQLIRMAQDPERGWELVRPDPAASAEGRLVNTALYGAASPVGAPIPARDFEVAIARGLDDGGYQLGDTRALLCRHQQRGADGDLTALLVSEHAVARFNQGGQWGYACPAVAAPQAADPTAPAAADPPETPDPPPVAGCGAAGRLVAFYPTDTLALAYPVVRVSWQPRDSPQAAAAADFQAWLSTGAGQAALAAAGWRPAGTGSPETPAPSPLSPECGGLAGALADVDYPDRVPAEEAVERAQDEYASAQRPGRVVIAMDISGSMGDQAGDGVTRFEVAVGAVAAALRRLGPRDEFGLRVFPAPDGDPALVEIGPASEPYEGQRRSEAALAALGELTPQGPTPLHRTIVEGVAEVGEFPGGVAALVVVTDGEDTEQDPEIEEALAALDDTAGVRVHVVAVGEASCGIDSIAGVVYRTNGGCLEPDFATLDAELGDLFGVLWSGG